MEIKTFMANRIMSQDGKFYYCKEGDTLYLQPVNQSEDKRFKIPKALQNHKDIAIWKIGPDGKMMKLNTLEVTE